MADPIPILAHLGIPAPTQIEQVHGGAASTIWRVETGQEAYALRLMPPQLRHLAALEAEAMRAASAGGVPTPRLYALTEWEGRPVMLISWMPGVPLAQRVQDDPAVSEVTAALCFQFGVMQARIHAISAPPELGNAPRGWIEWLRDDEPELQARLRALPPRNALIHLDYHPLNVLAEGDRISAVIDWTNARAGDPRADLARTYTILRLEPWTPDPEPPLLRSLRRTLSSAWWRGYVSVAGHPGDMSLFFAWAGFAMINDLSPRVGKPDSHYTPEHMARLHRWATRWKRRALLGF
jgi:aminoglycoside phosphotransferase (APT) family kinase protein